MKQDEVLVDVFEGDFPPKSYGKTLEEIEATTQQVVERLFRDDDGIMRCAVNGRTMKPYRLEDVKDRTNGVGTFVENSSIPKAIKPVWVNYENAGQASGVYLDALCAKAVATGDSEVRELARRLVQAIVTLWNNSATIEHSLGGGGRGWLPKPYAGIQNVQGMHECSVDQYCDITLGLESYYRTLASEDEKRQIEEIVISFANWWYDHDFAGVYLGQAIWYKRLYEHSMAASYYLYLYALANSWSPCRKFQHGFEIWQELKSALRPPGDPIWICMHGITLNCLERLLELRPDLADFWRAVAVYQAPLVVSSVEDRPNLNRVFEISGFGANYLTAAHRILPDRGYDRLVRKYLALSSERRNFYHVLRGLPLSDIQERMRGDDYRDMFHCENHVHWLAAYWRLHLSDSLKK